MKEKHKIISSIVILLVVTFIAFSPTLKNGFTNWDDQIMVTQNEKIMSLSWSSVKTMFTSVHERLYHPLVLISYALEYHFFKLDPTAFHVTNLIFHLLSTLLVFWFIFMLSRKMSVALIT
ncbi:hypothetical protein ACFLZ2_06165, partial [Candidatus Margulisiibacteriota bacterium]